MYRLYDYAPSLNCWKVRELFRRLRRPLELVPVSIFTGDGQSPKYLEMNPTGAVPVVETPSGETIAESNAILVMCAVGTELVPQDFAARGRMFQWLFFEQNYLECSLGSLQYWARTGKLKQRDPAVIAFQRGRALAALAALDRGLKERPFVAGALSIADIALYAYGHMAEAADLDPRGFGNYLAWRERFAQNDGPIAQTFPYSIDPASGAELPAA